MGYYIRVFGTDNPDIHIDEFIETLTAERLVAQFLLDPSEGPSNWTIIVVANKNGETLAQIEKNIVVEGELGQDELNEFKESIHGYKPLSAANWLTNYFEKVKVIYAFQLLNAAFDDNNFEIVSSIKSKIWNRTNGIIQADDEGFSNEDGYHILWQFSDDVAGYWSCAVLNSSNEWDNFTMDLGDKVQREEFKKGIVPKNAKLL